MLGRIGRRHRRSLERAWIVGSVAYGLLRVFVADRTVRQYGVNIWGFAAVELVTSFVYGLSTAKLVGALVDRRRSRVVELAPIALASFLAPEAYILLTARRLPLAVYLLVGGFVAVMGTIATVSLRRKVRAGRALHDAPAAVDARAS